MSDPSKTPAYGMPSYADTLLNVLLSGASVGLIGPHALTAPEAGDLVGALGVIANIAWAWINANPSRQSPIAMLFGLVRRAGQGARWNLAVRQMASALTPMARAAAEAEARKIAGPIAGPMARPIAGELTVDAIKAAQAAFLYPVNKGPAQ